MNRILVIGGTGTVGRQVLSLLEAADAQVRAMARNPGNAAGFSPDGKRVVKASVDQTARVWDAASGRVLTTLTGHTARVFSVDLVDQVTWAEHQLPIETN